MTTFDPSLTGSSENGIFGIPSTLEQSQLILIPMPWEVTASYGGGSSLGPESILKASPQLDLFDLDFKDAWKKGIHLLEPFDGLEQTNNELRELAKEVMFQLEKGETEDPTTRQNLDKINVACEKMNQQLYERSSELLKQQKIVGVIGGDHSSPLGLIRALGDLYKDSFGILHIDAHADLRCAYQGFTYSHASIMYNAMNGPTEPKKLVQVGIRDFCEEEYLYSQNSPKITTFFDAHIKARLFGSSSSNDHGPETWASIAREIVMQMPRLIYVSFDIDGLEPSLCPHTGTPVPGGLSFEHAVYLIQEISRQNKKIIGFDLCEVAPNPFVPDDEWDGNVGARILYQLCGQALKA